MLKILLMLMCLLICPGVVNAAESFESAKINLLCAMASLSAYSDDKSVLSRYYFTGRGWRINALTSQSDKINVKAYLISRADTDGRVTKILVASGTEDIKDIKVDLKTSRVPFNNNAEILVHKGFRDYADAELAGGVAEFIIDDLDNNPAETLYITGHSLGGAVALMTAARLVDAGIDTARMKVITFGMPAVGNNAFADTYNDKIDLMRVVTNHDVVSKSLKNFGYTHFGKVINYDFVETQDHNAHDMATYLDTAIRNYYDAGGFDTPLNFADKIDTPIYFAPIKIVNKSFTPKDERYIRAMFIDSLKSRLSNVTFAEPMFDEIKKPKDFSYDISEYIAPARQAGCRYIVADLLHTKSIRESRQRSLRVILEEAIFDLNGFPLSMNTSGTTTADLTAIEAVTFAQESLRQTREKILSDKKILES